MKPVAQVLAANELTANYHQVVRYVLFLYFYMTLYTIAAETMIVMIWQVLPDETLKS